MARPEPQPDDAVIFFGLSLALGIASRHLLRGTRVPYTVALLVLGVALGSLEYGTEFGLGKLGAGIRLWANINPDLLLSVFLPALLFESSFSMEIHQIKKCMAQMLLLAGPGVLISTCFLGILLKVTFPYNWDWKTSFLLGGLLSATDPVAVVALLKELGASKKLSTIIEGESLMNDGTAIVVYQLFYKMVLGRSFSAGDVIKFLSQVSLGAVAIGLAFGIASVLWLGYIFNDTVIEIALTLAVSYIAFFTAQDVVEVSGVLTVMTLGMFYAAAARTAFKGDGQQSLHHFWEMVAYIANTLIFILSGVVIADGVLQSENHFRSEGTSWGYLVLLYVFVQISRLVVVGSLYPFLRNFGYGLNWKEAAILVWSGLRGAVALSLSLSVKRASDGDQAYLRPDVGVLFVFFTGGIVFLTLIVNGSTTQFVLHMLGMDKMSETKLRILNYTKYELLNKAKEAFGDLRDDEELGPADWLTVKKYITCLNGLDEATVRHPHSSLQSGELMHTMNLKDIRVRLLNGVQAAYWEMLEGGRITQATANILMRSVDEAMDLMSREPLCDWTALRTNVNFPNHYRFLQMSKLPRRLVTHFIVERLESGCYICAAFLRAHRIARRQLHDFLGDSVIARTVILESTAEGEEAKKFLEDVRITFPQVLRVLKTRQVTYSVLTHLSSYVQNLLKVGLLEEKEMLHLDDDLQTDLKRLLRNPPLVKMARARDLLNSHPMVGALPPSVKEPLVASTKEVMKFHGATLYKEGTKANGIWLIAVGVVKWTSRSLCSTHSVDPIFSHGSTLGLYEVLIGKPYICDIVTDSVVHCFFIEAAKLEVLCALDPAIEGFLWQESAIVIARLLLPQLFEKMAMHEVRAIVAERSNVFIQGEAVVLRQNDVCILLEGFLKSDEGGLVGPPAVLLPLQTDLAFFGLERSAINSIDYRHLGSKFQVETRSRVIFFEIDKTVPEGGLQRTSSKLMQGAELPRTSTRDHGSLLSWPENYQAGRGHQSCIIETGEQERNSFSARAMQLSLYGSMLIPSPRTSPPAASLQGAGRTASPQNSSYPRAPSWSSLQPRPLTSVQSEGSSNGRRRGSVKFEQSPPRPVRKLPDKRDGDNSSDDESGSEEIIERVDSSTNLSFSQAGTSQSAPGEK